MAIDQDTIAEDNRKLRALIEATENVSLVQDAKNFLQKLQQIDSEEAERVEQDITDNIDASHIFDAAMSDDKARNTFSEINKAFAYGVNEYLKAWRNF